MTNSSHRLVRLAGLAALLLPLTAGAADRLRFEAGAGSTITDECLPCDRAPIERPLTGSLFLYVKDLTTAGASFEVSEVDLHDASEAPQYSVSGAGAYLRRSGKSQEMSLDLAVNRVEGIQLSSGVADVQAAWPAITVKLTESGERDPFHVYTLRLVLEPPSKQVVPYELVKGSEFFDDCTLCGRVTIPIPITGTFDLGLVENAANFYSYFRIEGLDFRSENTNFGLTITGGGCYAQGGDFALMQAISLELTVNGTAGALLASGHTQPAGRFPEIDIQLEHKNPESTLHVYTLHIIARPVETTEPPFRRGDSNDDGTVDISDPINLLLWRFGGGAAPACLEAADANGDGANDLSDAVSVLSYLFLNGPPPPAPGPQTCGPGTVPAVPCQAYSACAAAS